MKKISSKALLITGLIIEFGYLGFIDLISFLFPNMPGDVVLSLICILECLGVIFFVFSLAKYRMEKGKTKATNPIRALTPAQIVLVLSMLLIIFIMVFVAFGSNALNGLGAIAFFGIFASIVLAIVRAIKRIMAAIRSSRETHTPQSSSSQYHTKEYCERCGASSDKGTLKKLNGHKFCESCAEIMIEAQNSEIIKAKAKCCVCENEFAKSKMIFVDDQYICDNCFRARYSGFAPNEDNTEGL